MSFSKTISVFAALASIFGAGITGWKLAEESKNPPPVEAPSINAFEEKISELEKQIEERKELLKQSKDCVEGYKITFCVKFNPAAHQYDELRSPEEFGDYLANDVANYIIKDGFSNLDVSGFEVEEMTDEYKVEWKDFWENEE